MVFSITRSIQGLQKLLSYVLPATGVSHYQICPVLKLRVISELENACKGAESSWQLLFVVMDLRCDCHLAHLLQDAVHLSSYIHCFLTLLSDD